MSKSSAKKRVTNRRREDIRDKLEKFLSESIRNSDGKKRYGVSKIFSPKTFLEMARLYLDQRENLQIYLEVICSYVRTHKKAVEEMTEEDVEIVFQRLSVLQIIDE